MGGSTGTAPVREDELVIAERPFLAGRADNDHAASLRIDVRGTVFEAEVDAVRLDVAHAAVRQRMPVGRLTAEEEREAANAVVREGVGNKHGESTARVDLSGPQTRR